MIRTFFIFAAISLAAPALAQPATPEEYAKQTQAIAIRVQQQLMACWTVPEGEENERLAVDIGFFGAGALDGVPVVALGMEKFASKRPLLTESVMEAIAGCVPFEGLEALGAGAEERFAVTITFQS
ncbi:hypothetical protein VW35_09120 [Devosia soli]|uniref:TonB C-terminal domain-containing protein n=1 Tax=Devosia soli TaxID=361041 RepID=A0A0F5L8G8_9HYPH|nr:hypothetical protein [Devosia soli]KKB78676.1 hypothetical protein VW35_09120 [Devosia soli]